jgi:hypothetical protein
MIQLKARSQFHRCVVNGVYGAQRAIMGFKRAQQWNEAL